ncbi:MAG: PAS domain S-box protein [Gammaproteobacteria bacterium]|nr:PAS domain S-box protein [Gammaproteobacteria bacterium]MCW8927890.1 PAS domain S-box protein [Gammaproteobacteria bacterium]
MSDTLRILLLEGSTEDAQRVINAVRNGGLKAEFYCLQSAAELSSHLEQRNYDILLSNFQLPDATALDILATIRCEQLDLPVIVLSDGVGEELAVTVMHAGAHDFVTKANLARLVPAIERELEELAIHRRQQSAEAALRESERRFRQLTENIGEVFWLLDAQSGAVIYLSPAFEEVWEQPPRRMQENAAFLLETVHPEDYHRIQKTLQKKGWLGFNAEYRILLQDGSSRWIRTTSFPIRDNAGEIYRVAGLSIDISEHKHLAEEREMMSRALEQSADAVMITDADGIIVYANATFEEVSGYSKEEVLGDTPGILRSGFQDDQFYAMLWENLLNGLPFTDIFINRRKDGELFYEAKTITPVRGSNGELTHFVSTGKDITDRLKTRQRLHKMLHYDAVTGLVNRVLLQERMEQTILQAQQQQSRFGVMCVGFPLSELLGDVQQKLLAERLQRQVALRLTEIMGNNATVARLGKDEFLLLLKDVCLHEELERLAKQLVLAFAEPIMADGYELFLSPSVGISLFPGDGTDSDTLIRHAEAAMRDIRGREQGAYGFYTGEPIRQKHLSS